MPLTIGTTNSGKVREIAALLDPLGLDLRTLSLDVDEPFDTLRGNAVAKAVAYAQAAGTPALAEDSGLFVECLDDLPGPWSARFADLDLKTRTPRGVSHPGPETDAANNVRLLNVLKERCEAAMGDGWSLSLPAAQFRVCFVLALPNGDVAFETEASYPGWIIHTPRGTGGFGYDPIFVGHDTFGKTLAEIDGVRKNLRSHRKMGLDALYQWLACHLEVVR